MNKLYLGDNLNAVQERIKDETVGVVYLDPAVQFQRKLQRAFRDIWGATGIVAAVAGDKVAPAKGDFVDPSIHGARLALTAVAVGL